MSGVRELNRIRYLVIGFMAAVMALTPVYAAFAESQATPIVEPTPTPTEIAPATPDQSQEEALESSSIEQADVLIEGSLSGCVQSSESVPPGGTVSITCDFAIRAGIIGSPIAQVTRPELTGDFTASINIVDDMGSASMPPGSSRSVLSMRLGSAVTDGTRTARISILIYAPDEPTLEDQFSWEFTACRAAATGSCIDHSGSVDVALIAADISLVDGTDYIAECSDPVLTAVGFGERVVSTCSVTAGEIG